MTAQPEVVLLPCPFCGGKPSHYDIDRGDREPSEHSYECDQCDASVGTYITDEIARKCWNCRVPEASLTAALAEREAAKRELQIYLDQEQEICRLSDGATGLDSGHLKAAWGNFAIYKLDQQIELEKERDEARAVATWVRDEKTSLLEEARAERDKLAKALERASELLRDADKYLPFEASGKDGADEVHDDIEYFLTAQAAQGEKG